MPENIICPIACDKCPRLCYHIKPHKHLPSCNNDKCGKMNSETKTRSKCIPDIFINEFLTEEEMAI